MEITINCKGIDTKEQLHRILAEVLHFPQWYGNNLDALFDQLTSIPQDTHLIFENWNTLSPAFRGFRCVLADAQAENPVLTVTFR